MPPPPLFPTITLSLNRNPSGVHRGAEYTFDVSADLEELARTPIVVVCAGVKSILDIEKTLEARLGIYIYIFFFFYQSCPFCAL